MLEIQEKQRMITIAAIQMARNGLPLTGEIKSIIRDLLSLLRADSDDLVSHPSESVVKLREESLESKTLLMDILLLMAISDGTIEASRVMFLMKSLKEIRLDPQSYVVFPYLVPFDDLRKKTNVASNTQRGMLWNKISHSLKNRIFFPQWSNAMSCFVKTIDSQHKTMVRRFSDYILKLQNNQGLEIKKMLAELKDYTSRHFKTEEAYMTKANYPLLSDHQAIHAAFLEGFKSSLVQFKKNSDIEFLKDAIAADLTWFLNHVRDHDVKAGFFIKLRSVSTHQKNRLVLFGDNPAYLDGLKSDLNDLGFESVTIEETEKAAFEWIQTNDFKACFIASDTDLFKGIDLFKRIRQHTSNMPVFLLPLPGNQNDMLRQMDKSKVGHLHNVIATRPFEPDYLVYHLNRLIFK